MLPAICQKIQDGQDQSSQLLILDFWLPNIYQTITFCCLSMVFSYVSPRELLQPSSALPATPPQVPGRNLRELPVPMLHYTTHSSVCVSETQSEFSAWKHGGLRTQLQFGPQMSLALRTHLSSLLLSSLLELLDTCDQTFTHPLALTSLLCPLGSLPMSLRQDMVSLLYTFG